MQDDDVVISVENLSKQYLIGHETAGRLGQTTFREALARNVRALGRSALDIARGRQIVQGHEVEAFWALKDVSFQARRGEVLGIIGRNGAGKSTLLKILSRITEPTEGRAVIRGGVASLLEVGTGFHPELSGRENIYLNGAILGMARAEIRRKFDEIVAFAEIERFLDTPVKRYSSGMYMRLAFAVAAHLEPDILVVDEVLAVGDLQFQRKCLGKMQDIAGRDGRTVLFVSHNMEAITRLCGKALLLEQGRIAAGGDVADVVPQYLNSSGSLLVDSGRMHAADSPFRLRAVHVCDHQGRKTAQVLWEEPFSVEIDYDVVGEAANCVVWTAIRDARNQEVMCTWDVDAKPELRARRDAGHYNASIKFPASTLNVGYYTLIIGLAKIGSMEMTASPAVSVAWPKSSNQFCGLSTA